MMLKNKKVESRAYILIMKNQILPGLLLLCLFTFSCRSKVDTSVDKAPTPIATLQNSANTPEPSKEDHTLTNNRPAKVYGIDISHFQGNELEYLDKHGDSLTFIFCKATEGINYTDPQFKRNWKLIREKGFIRGSYHFYHSKDDPVIQAKFYAQTIDDLLADDLPPVVDFEGYGIDEKTSVEKTATDLLTFLVHLESQTKRRPMIYTNERIASKYLRHSTFADYALWIAEYNGKAQPDLPHTWEKKGWTFWQKSSSYSIDQMKNDFDVFDGDHVALTNFIKSY